MPAANVKVVHAKAKKKLAAPKANALRSRGGRMLTPEELHKDMVAYGNKMAATKESALAFLKRIGAPVKG